MYLKFWVLSATIVDLITKNDFCTVSNFELHELLLASNSASKYRGNNRDVKFWELQQKLHIKHPQIKGCESVYGKYLNVSKKLLEIYQNVRLHAHNIAVMNYTRFRQL